MRDTARETAVIGMEVREKNIRVHHINSETGKPTGKIGVAYVKIESRVYEQVSSVARYKITVERPQGIVRKRDLDTKYSVGYLFCVVYVSQYVVPVRTIAPAPRFKPK
jgi:hypothetical protein